MSTEPSPSPYHMGGKLMVWFGLVTEPAWLRFMVSNNSSAAFLPNCSVDSCKLSWRLVKNVIATNTAGKGCSVSLKISEGFALTNAETPSQQRSLVWQPTCPTKTNTAAKCLSVLSFFLFFSTNKSHVKNTPSYVAYKHWNAVLNSGLWIMPNRHKHGCRVSQHLIKNVLKMLENVPISR